MKRWTLGLAALVLFLDWAGEAKAGNLVVNGGFESGDYTGWTLGGDTTYDTITSSPAFVHSGTYAAQFAGAGSDTLLYQTIATTPGASYQISYWLLGDGDLPNNASVSFGGQTLFSQASIAAFPYTEYTFTVQAAAPVSTLQFAARDDPGYFYLDNVSVTAAPEPSAGVLLGVGAVGLLGYGWWQARTRHASQRLVVCRL